MYPSPAPSLQVQRTCEALNAHGFRDIRTMEVLLRSHEVSRAQLQTDMEAAPAAPTSKRQARQQQQGRGAKRPRTEGGGEGEAAGPAGEAGAGAPAAAEGAGSGEAPAAAAAGGQAVEAAAPADGQQKQQTRQVVSKPVPFGRGHTGYLTFARRVVSP